MPKPPEITSSEPGSFTWRVLHDRHPAILDQVRASDPRTPAQLAALARLGDEYARGDWDDAPFLRAEEHFYRTLLHDVDYFTHRRDPFAALKRAELDDPGLGAFLASFPDDLPGLLAASVWGNRADLSFRLQQADSTEVGGLIADDRAAAVAHILGGTPTIALVTDNAGRELIADLFLIDHLLASGRTDSVDVQVKPYPYFVSDVTAEDLRLTLRRLADTPGRPAEVGARIGDWISQGRVTVWTHPFHAAPAGFDEMPPDLAARLAASGVTILKGDLNYRRLVGDRRWPPTTAFAEVTGYFPNGVLVLRTLKSEVVAGLDPATVAALDATGEPWRTTGTHGVIQFRPPAAPGQTRNGPVTS